MLRDDSVVGNETAAGCEVERPGGEPWRDVDRQLRRAARRRTQIDHEELVLIREAIALQVWRPLGMVSMRDYLEEVFGYGPTVASERIRVAEALDAMPALDRALANGELPYTAVREISRIATRATESEWVDACRGKKLRQIEELLTEREPGDRPSSPRKPDAGLRDVRWRVRPSVWAKLRTTKRAVEESCGERIDDSAFADALCDAVMALMAQRAETSTDAASPPVESTPAEKRVAGRARYQIAIMICRACGVARQDAGGVDVAISAAEVERALCDAEWVDERGRVKQDIPPATRRLVRRRDGDRCTVPGCRSAQCIDIHHIQPVSEGGGHEPENLTMLCGAHHDARHDGRLSVRGRAPDLEFEWTVPGDPEDFHVEEEPAQDSHVEEAPDETLVEASSPRVEDLTLGRLRPCLPRELRDDATLALKTLGFPREVARAAVDGACLRLAPGCDLETLIRAALQSLAPGRYGPS